MFDWIKEYFRKRAIKAFKPAGNSRFLNLKDVESVGFVYNLSSAESVGEICEVYNFLKWRGFKISFIVVETKKGTLATLAEPLEYPDMHIVKFEDLNWIGEIVESEEYTEFLSRKSNVFISFNPDNNFSLNCVVNRVVSDLRIGMTNDMPVLYDMVVEGKDKSLLSPFDYLNQIFHYLKIIKSID